MAIRYGLISIGIMVLLTSIVTAYFFSDSNSIESGDLASRALSVDIQEGKITQEEIQAQRGEIVTLKISVDEPWFFHLHGYDLAEEVYPAAPVLFTFEAIMDGRFEIGLHPLSESLGDAGNSEHSHDDTKNSMQDMQSDSPEKERQAVVGGYISIMPA